MEGNLHFKIDWASLTVARKFTVFVFFYFVSKYNPQGGGGGLYLERRFKGGFFALRVWGLIFGGAYTWRGLFFEFYGIRLKMRSNPDVDVGEQQGNPRLA